MPEPQPVPRETLPVPPPTPPVRDDASTGATAARSCPGVPGYEVLSELGRGGMGVVYKARQTSLNRPVALKMLLAGAHADESALSRFQREAEAAARMTHPNIVRIYEVGTHEGLPFFSMELIEGGTLADRLREGPLSPRAAAELVETLARAVFTAHEVGIVHRDLKPANILLQQNPTTEDTDHTDGQKQPSSSSVLSVSSVVDFLPKITDFGLAKRLDVPRGPTQSGAVVGTPNYMAPEQAQGAGGGGQVGRAADVYALGAILYECLTGRPPFLAETPLETLLQVVEQEPVPPARLRPGLPRDLQTICLRCLDKSPRRRYVSALSLANDLAHFLAGEPIIARPAGRVERALKWARRRPALAALLGTLAAVTVVGFLVVAHGWRQAEQAREREEDLRLTAEDALRGEKEQRQQAETARRKEKEARAAADAALHREEGLRGVSDQALYSNRIAFADRECTAHNLQRAEELLEVCPPGPRHWEWNYLKRLCHTEIASLHVGEQPINVLALSPDGKVLASGEGHPYQPGTEGEVRLWDAGTLRPIRTLQGLNGAAMELLFSADGKHLVAVGGSFDLSRMLSEKVPLEQATECEARIWDVATGKTIDTRPGVSSLAWSGDSKIVASADLDRQVRVWDLGTNKVRFRPAPMPGLVCALVFSPCGRWLAGWWQQIDLTAVRAGRVSLDGILKTGITVWRLDNGKEHFSAAGGSTPAFTKDGKQLSLASLDGTVHIWDVEQKQRTLVLRGHTNLVTGMTFRPAGAAGGPLLATAGMDRSIRLWDPVSGRAVQTVGAHAQWATGVRFSADGTRLFSSGLDGRIKTWSVGAGRGHRRLDGLVGVSNAPSFDPTSRFLASAGIADVRVWDVGTEKSVAVLAGPRRCAAFAPKGTVLAVGAGREVRLLDTAGLATGKTPALVRTLRGHAADADSLAWRPDGERLAAASISQLPHGLMVGDVIVWDSGTGREVWRRRTVGGPAVALAWAPSGRRLALSTIDGTLEVWDANTGDVLLTLRRGAPLQGAYVAMASVAFSPDGKLLAAAGGNALNLKETTVVSLWDSTTGRLSARLPGHTALVTGLCFSPDGRRLASASCDLNLGMTGEVKLWDIPSASEVLTLDGRLGVVFSPDGRLLASAGFEALTRAEIRIWDGGPPPRPTAARSPELAPPASPGTLKR